MVRPLIARTNSSSALIYVEGCIPWNELTFIPNMLGMPDLFDSHIATIKQPKDPTSHRHCERVQGWATSPRTSNDSTECSDNQERARTSRRKFNATQSQFPMRWPSGSVQNPHVTHSGSGRMFINEPGEPEIHPDGIVESNASNASQFSLSQSSSVATGSGTVSTEAPSTNTGSNPLSCTACHKPFRRPCELR